MGPSSGVFGPEARLTRQSGSIVLPHRSERPYRAALALRTSDLVLTLVQSGGIAGLEMQAVLKLSELPPVDADGVRGLLRRVLAEATRPGVAPPAVPDACEYELTVSEAGAEQRIVTRDGALTPAERELIGLLRPRLTPVRA